MSNAQPMATTGERIVPLYVDEYIAQSSNGTVNPETCTCTGCFDHPAIASWASNDYCRPCWASMHAFDQAEEKMVRALIGGAVAAALAAGAGEHLIRAGVEDALSGRICLAEPVRDRLEQ